MCTQSREAFDVKQTMQVQCSLVHAACMCRLNEPSYFFYTVVVALAAPVILLAVGTEDAQKILGDELQGLTDTDISTCVIRRNKKARNYRQLNVA